jgi:hypothetical protein
VINGGCPPAGATGRLAEFIQAAGAYRCEVARMAKAEGSVETLTGRRIPLAADDSNFRGKAVNRVIQGSAADCFNRAVLRVDAALTAERLPAAVAFILYDELWVETDPSAELRVIEIVGHELEAAALDLGIAVPVRIETEAIEPSLPADDPYDREERAAALEYDGGLSRGEAERRAGAAPVAGREVDLSGVPF